MKDLFLYFSQIKFLINEKFDTKYISLKESVKHSSKLITNACAFIAVIVAELSYQSAGTVVSIVFTCIIKKKFQLQML